MIGMYWPNTETNAETNKEKAKEVFERGKEWG